MSAKARAGGPALWSLRRCKVRRLPGLRLYELPPAFRIGRVGVVYEKMAPRVRLPNLYHRRTDELVLVTRGSGWGKVGGRRMRLVPGSILWMPAGTPHEFVSGGGPLEAVVLFSPPMDFAEPDAYTAEPGGGRTRVRPGGGGGGRLKAGLRARRRGKL